MPPEVSAPPAATPHKSTFESGPMTAPPVPTAPKSPSPKPAPVTATPAAPDEGSSDAEKMREAMAKAKEGSRRFNEQKEARARAEKALAAERERASSNEAHARKITEERQREIRQAAAKKAREEMATHLAKNPSEFLQRQMEELLQLKERDAQRDEEFQALKKKLADKDASETRKVAESNFISASNNAKLYPNLSKLPDDVILDLGIQLGTKQLRNGVHLDDDEILQKLEENLAGNPKNASSKTPEEQPSKPNQASVAPKKTDTPRTITNELSKPYKLPPNFDDLDDRLQRKELAKMMAATSKK